VFIRRMPRTSLVEEADSCSSKGGTREAWLLMWRDRREECIGYGVWQTSLESLDG